MVKGSSVQVSGEEKGLSACALYHCSPTHIFLFPFQLTSKNLLLVITHYTLKVIIIILCIYQSLKYYMMAFQIFTIEIFVFIIYLYKTRTVTMEVLSDNLTWLDHIP